MSKIIHDFSFVCECFAGRRDSMNVCIFFSTLETLETEVESTGLWIADAMLPNKLIMLKTTKIFKRNKYTLIVSLFKMSQLVVKIDLFRQKAHEKYVFMIII